MHKLIHDSIDSMAVVSAQNTSTATVASNEASTFREQPGRFSGFNYHAHPHRLDRSSASEKCLGYHNEKQRVIKAVPTRTWPTEVQAAHPQQHGPHPPPP